MISRSIINDDDFLVRIRLRKRALNRRPQARRSIVTRDDDTNHMTVENSNSTSPRDPKQWSNTEIHLKRRRVGIRQGDERHYAQSAHSAAFSQRIAMSWPSASFTSGDQPSTARARAELKRVGMGPNRSDSQVGGTAGRCSGEGETSCGTVVGR